MSRGAVVYYRVSTAERGGRSLGLDAQRATVAAFLGGGCIVAEYTEVESGRNDKRPALDYAIQAAQLHRVPLVVAKVDRLSRSASFLSRLLKSGVEVKFCELPEIDGPAAKFMLNQMVVIAELEAGRISARTKAALAVAKAQGKVLGGNRGVKISRAAARAGWKAGIARANARAAELAPVVEELSAIGICSASAVAKALNERGILAARGGKWCTRQTGRLLERLARSRSVCEIQGH